MEYLLLSDGSVKVIPTTDIYAEVEALLHEHPGSEHYWINEDDLWRMSYLSAEGSRMTDRLRVGLPDVIKLAQMLG